jgi:hypothetical protein
MYICGGKLLLKFQKNLKFLKKEPVFVGIIPEQLRWNISMNLASLGLVGGIPKSYTNNKMRTRKH